MTTSSAPRRTIALILALTLLVGALALCLNRTRNGDLYLQVLTGRFITEHGLATHDPFATIEHGRPWLNQQWLSELAFYRIADAVGFTGLSVLYAALIAAPLALLMWALRRKGPALLGAAAVLYFPALLAVVHPRAAGFTMLAFSLLVLLIMAAWRAPSEGNVRLRWAIAGILVLFAVWANIHGGFVAGLLLIALVTVGLAVDRWRGVAGEIAAHRVAMLGLSGVIAAAVVTFATPLGTAIWSYIASFRNPALYLATKEWEPASQSIPAMIYLAIAAAFAALLWWRGPAPRRLMPPLVVAGFVAFAAVSLRNVVFVGPVLAFPIAWSAPDRAPRVPRGAIAVAAATAAAAALVWGLVLGPARDDPPLGSRAVDYALRHPPRHGRIATYAGTGSYLLWRSHRTNVVIDGWIEHFRPGVLRRNYGLLRGWYPNPLKAARRLDVRAVIAHLPGAIEDLEAHGFVPKVATQHATYLVRRGP
ncbi:MAG TPA: hypothetical protein VKG89_09045 [Solirubrobacterales bacterium]|nr:hypothetical protein [Solirubrobacterales bacterium]